MNTYKLWLESMMLKKTAKKWWSWSEGVKLDPVLNCLCSLIFLVTLFAGFATLLLFSCSYVLCITSIHFAYTHHLYIYMYMSLYVYMYSKAHGWWQVAEIEAGRGKKEIVGMVRGCIKTATCGKKLPRNPTSPHSHRPIYTKLAYILGLRVSPSHR